MAKRQARASSTTLPREAAVWIDRDEAVIVETGPGDRRTVEVLVRGPAEAGPQFEARAIDEVLDDPHVVVSGPLDSRLEFERAYVALTHRPDRLADIEPDAPTPREALHTS